MGGTKYYDMRALTKHSPEGFYSVTFMVKSRSIDLGGRDMRHRPRWRACTVAAS